MSGIFQERVTVYHCDGEQWTRSVIEGVFCREERVLETAADGERALRRRLKATIPQEAAQSCPAQPGDVIVRGEGPENADDALLIALRGTGEARAVVRVTDNTGAPRLKHWRIEAE